MHLLGVALKFPWNNVAKIRRKKNLMLNKQQQHIIDVYLALQRLFAVCFEFVDIMEKYRKIINVYFMHKIEPYVSVCVSVTTTAF